MSSTGGEDEQTARLRDELRSLYLNTRADWDLKHSSGEAATIPDPQFPNDATHPILHHTEFSKQMTAGMVSITEAEVVKMWTDTQKRIGSWVGDPVRGINAIASPFARSLVAPYDLLQTRRQLTAPLSLSPYHVPVATASPIVTAGSVNAATASVKAPKLTIGGIRRAEGGWASMWKGNGLNAASGFGRYAISGLCFRAAETNRWFGEFEDVSSPDRGVTVPHFAFVTGVYGLSRSLFYPLEVMRTLRQADPHMRGQPYTPFTAGANAGSAFPKLADTYKLVSRRGMGLAALSEMLMTGSVLAASEQMNSIRKSFESDLNAATGGSGSGGGGGTSDLSLGMAGGIFTGALGVFLLQYPLETLSKRMRVSGVGPFPAYQSVGECYRATGGWRGQFRGFVPYLMKCVPLGLAWAAAYTAYCGVSEYSVAKKIEALDYNLLTKQWNSEYRERQKQLKLTHPNTPNMPKQL